MNDTAVIEKISLTNGETLEIEDQSRMVGQDTWLVTLVFRIKITINEKNTLKLKPVTEDEIKLKLGDTLIYNVRHERNFINEHQKDNMVNELRDSFLGTNLKYLSNSDFAEKFILKKYYEKKTR